MELPNFNLNETVQELFKGIIYSDELPYKVNYIATQLDFVLPNGKEVSIWVSRTDQSCEYSDNKFTNLENFCYRPCLGGLIPTDRTSVILEMRFYLSVGGKQYSVHPFDRVEQAKVLDRIDYLIEAKERENINSCLNSLATTEDDI